MSNCDVILLASGRGVRAGKDKILAELGESNVILRALSPFLRLNYISKIIIVANRDNKDLIKSLTASVKEKPIEIILGGDTRCESVSKGLKKVSAEYTLIHDGARPFLSEALIERVYLSAKEKESAIPVINMVNALRIVKDNKIISIAQREDFKEVQTPQGFLTEKIKLAFSQIKHYEYEDESGIFLKYVEPPNIVLGEEKNRKITSFYDLENINSKAGIGYDIHRLKENLPLILCGVRIPHNKGLIAHSDGDVAIHAIIDALLSAAGLRDIGYYFPDNDEKYKDISSLILLSEVKIKLEKLNLKIISLSLLIIAENPRLSPYVEEMKEKIKSILDINDFTVSLKTNEGIGDIGKEEAIAAYALCNLI